MDFLTLSGKRFPPADMTVDDFDLYDALIGMAQTRRYNGQTRQPWSVGQHILLGDEMLCVLGASDLERKFWFAHDLPEYVTGDMVSPVKALGNQNFEQLEEHVYRVIAKVLELPTMTNKQQALLTRMDHECFLAERWVLQTEWFDLDRPSPNPFMVETCRQLLKFEDDTIVMNNLIGLHERLWK